eukprot:jgi/Tetstr1/465897/TSEL_010513.t1
MKVIAKKFRGVWHYGVITGVVTEWVLEDYGGATQWRAHSHLCQPGLCITHLRPAMLQLDFRFQYPYPMTTLQHVLRKGGTSVYWTGCV